MARFKNRPKNRDEFKDYILRKLGAPVIDIELADSQLDDVIDDAVETFNHFHFDGAFRTYRRIQITTQMIEDNKVIPKMNLQPDASDVSPMYDPRIGSSEGSVGLDASGGNKTQRESIIQHTENPRMVLAYLMI